MAFTRKLMLGFDTAITNLKTWIGQNYAAKSHTHTASQISGIVTGLTATEGSNSNGSWRRYSDGFTIQWGVYDSVTAVNGGVANARTVNFPKKFAVTPVVILQPNSGIGQMNDMAVPETSTTYFKLQNVNQSQNKNVLVCHWIAIGHTSS